jgi:hypothetical protein
MTALPACTASASPAGGRRAGGPPGSPERTAIAWYLGILTITHALDMVTYHGTIA